MSVNAILTGKNTSIVEENKQNSQKFWRGTQEEYNALIESDSINPDIMYIVDGISDDPQKFVKSFNGRAGAVVPKSGDYTAEQVGAIPTTAKGTANGVATLGNDGKVPNTQLPEIDVAMVQAAVDAAASAQAAKEALEQSIVENPGSTVIDPTFSISGAAAEAAAVGQLKQKIVEISSYDFSGKTSFKPTWELGAITNEGTEEYSTGHVRTGCYLLKKGDSFKIVERNDNFRVFYYELDGSFIKTLYSVEIGKTYDYGRTVLVRFRENYHPAMGGYDWFNKYLTIEKKSLENVYESEATKAFTDVGILNNYKFGYSQTVGIEWERGAINNEGGEEASTNHLRTGYFLLNKGDKFVCSRTDLRVFYYSVTDKTFIETLYSVTANKEYIADKPCFVRFRVGYNTNHNWFNDYLTLTKYNSDVLQDDEIRKLWDVVGVEDANVTAIKNKVVNAIDGNNLVFVHFTDSHCGAYPMTLDRTKKHISKALEIAKAVNADFIIHTGDIIQGNGSINDAEYGTDDKTRYGAIISDMRKNNVPFIWCLGNTNHDFGIITDGHYALNRGQVSSYMGRYGADKTTVAKYGDLNTYYYFDMPLQNCRVVVLDSDDMGANRDSWGWSDVQVSWLETTLADAKAKEMPVVVFSHMPPSANLMPSCPQSGVNVISKLETFAQNGGKVLGFVHGHVHWDNLCVENGIPYISCACDQPVATTETFVPTWGAKVVPQRVVDTLSEYAIDVYVMNADSGKAKIFRYGAGTDREI